MSGARALVAGLPMYEFPWIAPALDAVWGWIGEHLRASGVPAPAALDRERPLEALWRDPGLVFGQTCGYPYRHGLSEVVEVLGTPVFSFEGCEGPNHCSFLVVRRDDPRFDLADFAGARAAINSRDSNTGMNLFRASVARVAVPSSPLAGEGPRRGDEGYAEAVHRFGIPLIGRSAPPSPARGEEESRAAFFAEVLVTGAHVASLRAIADNAADIAAIDCVTFGLVARGAPALLDGIRVIGRTPSSPGLPFIVSRALPEAIRAMARETLLAAVREPALREAMAALGIIGAEVLPPDAYERIDELEVESRALGYGEL